MATLPGRAKANSFGYIVSTSETSKNGVGAPDKIKETAINGKPLSKISTPGKLFQTTAFDSKYMNPEEEHADGDWEEDTNDTEIMKSINSLLDSGR